jgi:hypothetical protein
VAPLLSLKIVAAGAAGIAAYAAAVEARVSTVSPAAIDLANMASRDGSIPASPLAAAIVEARLTARLWADIDAVQRAAATTPGGCSAAPILLVPYPRNGFASAFGFIAGALMQAHMRARALVFLESSTWGYGCGSGASAWACYFHDVSPCTFANSAVSTLNTTQLPLLSHDIASESGAAGPRVLLMTSADGSFYFHSALSTLVPPPAYAALGVAWWRTQFFAYLFRPNDRVSAFIRQSFVDLTKGDGKRASGQPYTYDPFLSWHVRQGDKVVEVAEVPPLDTYLDGVVTLASQHCVRRVFLATDSPAVAAAAPALLSKSGLSVFSLQDAARFGFSNSTETALVAATGGRDVAVALALDAIANIWLLSEGALFAGMMRSNFGRLAVDLMFAKGLAAAPAQWHGPDSDCSAIDCATYLTAPHYWRIRSARVAAGVPPGMFL